MLSVDKGLARGGADKRKPGAGVLAKRQQWRHGWQEGGASSSSSRHVGWHVGAAQVSHEGQGKSLDSKGT